MAIFLRQELDPDSHVDLLDTHTAEVGVVHIRHQFSIDYDRQGWRPDRISIRAAVVLIGSLSLALWSAAAAVILRLV